MAATQAGMIMGTAAYMSPEQAAGKPVDKRADIWSFGVVLWEMLTGQRLFDGETVSHTLADVLRAPINFEKLPEETPRAIRELIKRCLDRDVKNRLRDIGEARFQIQANLAEAVSAIEIPQQAKARSSKLPWIAAAVLAAGFAASSWIAYRATRPAELKPLVRLDADLGPNVSLSPGPSAILSPDGTRLAIVSQSRLFTRRLDQPNFIELPGTQGATSPFFSPDGQWVAFFSQGKLRKISVEGGGTIALCDAATSFTGGSWGEDGNLIVSLASRAPLMQIPASGGTPMPVTDLDRGRGEASHRWPHFLPGSKAVLFMAHTSNSGFTDANIDVMTLADRRRKTLVRGGLYPHYLPSGHLLYVSRGTLFAVHFDLDRLEVRGTPVPVLEQVAYSAQYGYALFDFSRNGMLIYRSGEGAGKYVVQWLDGAGKTQPLLAKPGDYGYPKLSPDGQRLAIGDTSGSNEGIWVYDPPRDTITRLTFQTDSPATWPIWTPDGRYVLFSGANGMYWTRADGAGKAQPLTQSKFPQYPGSVTVDGKRLAYYQTSGPTGTDLWTVPLLSDTAGVRAGKPEIFLQTPLNERHPAFSPDGRWLAYDSDESGSLQIYVRAFPDKGGKWQVSSDEGSFPEWSRDGHELFFRNLDNQIMVASYSAKGDSFVADKARLWSEKRVANRGTNPSYDVAPDGKRIAALMPVEGAEGQKPQNHLIFLENFFDELRRRVPVGK